jgi:hypothetical protein
VRGRGGGRGRWGHNRYFLVKMSGLDGSVMASVGLGKFAEGYGVTSHCSLHD